MKKNFLGLVAIPMLALLATSCAQETVETKGGDNVLTYGVATGKQALSRAVETKIENLHDGFPVYVFYTASGAEFETPFFNVAYSGGAWNYGTTVYHPTTGLSHYATDPAQTYSGATPGASVDFAFEADGQTDLIAAATTTTLSDVEADLTFKHLLSQINFVVSAPEDIDITISNITVNNVYGAGTYTLTNAHDDNAWLLTGNPDADYTYTLGGEGYEYGPANGSLMLMPQSFEENEEASFSFTYTLKAAGTATIIGASDGPITVPFSTLTPDAWAKGTRYLYAITFDGPAKLSYTVTEVEGWVPEEDAEINAF